MLILKPPNSKISLNKKMQKWQSKKILFEISEVLPLKKI